MESVSAIIYYVDSEDNAYKTVPAGLCGVPAVGDYLRGRGLLWKVRAVQFNFTAGPSDLSIRADLVPLDSEIVSQFQLEAGSASSSQELGSRGFEQGPGPI